MKINEYFDLREFVDPVTFAKYGENSIWFLDPKIIAGATLIRKSLGPVTINNWHIGGPFSFRGFRPHNCTIGAPMSQHRYGRGIDIEVDNVTPQQVYKWITDNWTKFKLNNFFTTIEDIAFTSSWVHLDCRNVGMMMPPTPLIVKP